MSVTLNSRQQDLLTETLSGNNLAASAEQMESLSIYLELLVRWNAKMNLTGAGNLHQALALCLDSIYLAGFLSVNFCPPDAQIWDLGAGAGLPGVPLRIFWPMGHYTMVEARQKRALFLQTCLARLNLPATSAFLGRAESFMAGKKADLILSRAFLPQEELLELIAPHLEPEGQVLLMRNQAWLEQPGWKLAAEKDYQAGGKTRYLALLSQAKAN